MSVLQRDELDASPLADLHAIASELGIDGYRGLRREKLIGAILDAQGAGDDASGDGAGAPPAGEIEDEAAAEAPEGDVDEEPEEEAEPRARKGRSRAGREREPRQGGEREAEEAEGEEVVAGVLDVLPNGSGFMRRDDDGAGDDVYVSPAQIRRCELRSGDEVAGPVRGPRRNERHPSLVRVETVNGRAAEPPEQRPRFEDLTAVHPRERLPAPPALGSVPFGKGSRVAVAGPPGAGSTRLLREVVATLAGAPAELAVAVLLGGARPEEVTDWRRDAGVRVYGGAFDSPPEELERDARLAVERAKRIVERGGDAVVVVDSVDAFEPPLARRLLGAARNVEDGGSLTVVAAVGEDWQHLRLASTRIVLEPGAGEPRVATERSGSQRADLLE